MKPIIFSFLFISFSCLQIQAQKRYTKQHRVKIERSYNVENKSKLKKFFEPEAVNTSSITVNAIEEGGLLMSPTGNSNHNEHTSSTKHQLKLHPVFQVFSNHFKSLIPLRSKKLNRSQQPERLKWEDDGEIEMVAFITSGSAVVLIITAVINLLIGGMSTVVLILFIAGAVLAAAAIVLWILSAVL